ncbi:alkyl hydroperoxide reductase subunit F [Vagococcus elongatus]|uniref:alkyl hydroperoxide reductase subunit F n=1 Tax=Vagococcus elongatus TaxID=180344 RepID=UPI001FE76E1D|nr:alkyl hydroperoxide reductase subunit F [Vagococcus elongatus]
MLDTNLVEQLKQYLELLESDIVINLSVDDQASSKEMLAFVEEVAQLSPKITVAKVSLERTPSFSINNLQEDSGITFAGIPLGHEFTSFVLALLQVGGRKPKIEENLIEQIKKINTPLKFETYVSLTCHNCPDVVQTLNIMSVLNPAVSHTMIDGKIFSEEVEEKNIFAVPTVYLNGEEFHSGRTSLEEILEKLGINENDAFLNEKEPYDVLVVGGGVAGATSAIYSARKGIKTGIVAETFGGQVLETAEISNFPSISAIEGTKLIGNLERHVLDYDVTIMKNQRATAIEKKDFVEVTLANGAVLKSRSVVLSTGARWRNLNIPGEQEFKNKGVAYCPHCDGPLFKDKPVAVVGGGNSGIEAAIDLAGVAQHVTVLEFMPELKADEVLQKRLYSLDNVTVLTNVATKEISGNAHVEGLSYVENDTGQQHTIDVNGVFILIGLMPNTEWLKNSIELTERGEIIVDAHGATNIPGVFAAGDCTDSAYKQIVISMGSGATAALGAFDYLIRQL